MRLLERGTILDRRFSDLGLEAGRTQSEAELIEKPAKYIGYKELKCRIPEIDQAERKFEELGCPEAFGEHEVWPVVVALRMCYLALRAILKVLISIEGKL